jgi:hypothetical protein
MAAKAVPYATASSLSCVSLIASSTASYSPGAPASDATSGTTLQQQSTWKSAEPHCGHRLPLS